MVGVVVGKDDNHTHGRESGQLEKHFIVSRALFQHLPRSLVDGVCPVAVWRYCSRASFSFRVFSGLDRLTRNTWPFLSPLMLTAFDGHVEETEQHTSVSMGGPQRR